MSVEVSTNLRLVFVYPHLLDEGGVPYETRALINALRRSTSADVSALSRPAKHATSSRSAKLITSFSRSEDDLPHYTPYGLTSLIRSFARPQRPHIVCLIGCRRLDFLVYAAFSRLLGARVMVFTHGLLNPHLSDVGWGGERKGLLRRFAERAFKRVVSQPLVRCSTALRALSDSEAAALRRFGARRVIVLSDGIDLAWLSAAGTVRATSSGCGPVRFLYMGRPEEYQKGLDLMVLALREAHESGKNVELVIAGPHPEVFALLVKTKLGVMPAYIRIIGPVADAEKARAFRESHYFVHFSRFEGMAKSVREAAASGLPILASYESNFGDWVERYRMGFAVHAADQASTAKAFIAAASASQRDWQEMHQAALRYARDHLWPEVAIRFERAAREL